MVDLFLDTFSFLKSNRLKYTLINQPINLFRMKKLLFSFIILSSLFFSVKLNAQLCDCPAGATIIDASFSNLPTSNTDYCINSSVTLTGSFALNNSTLCVASGVDVIINGSLNLEIVSSSFTMNDNSSVSMTGSLTMNPGVGEITLGECTVLEVCGTTTINDDILFVGDASACESHLITRGAVAGTHTVADDIYWTNTANHSNPSTPDCGDFAGFAGATVCPNGDPFVAGFSPTGCNQAAGIQDAITLPIELIFFNSNLNDGVVKLKWSTATEINNDYFNIQHSTDALDFEVIGIVRGAGTSYQIESYEFEYDSPSNGINYFRLQQVDYDGQSTFSPVKSNRFIGKSDLGLINHQNTLEVTNTSESFEWMIYEFNGVLVKSGYNNEFDRINISELSFGGYLISIHESGSVVTKRFIKN